MPSALESLAHKIKSGVRSAGTLRIWGINSSRPGDMVYQLASASNTNNGVLRLQLALESSSPVVEIDAPTGVKIADGNLSIAGAAAIRFDGEDKPERAGAREALFLGD